VAGASDRLEREVHTEIPYACGGVGVKGNEAYCTISWTGSFRSVANGISFS